LDLDARDGRLTWTTESFATNPTRTPCAGGRRYNFRFDASALRAWRDAELVPFGPAFPHGDRALHVRRHRESRPCCAKDPGSARLPVRELEPARRGEAASTPSRPAVGSRRAASRRLASDTLVLAASGMPESSALFFQGTLSDRGGAGVPFGDGLRCAGGSNVRLGTKLNAGGASSYPGRVIRPSR
jgi:hypothetical protein